MTVVGAAGGLAAVLFDMDGTLVDSERVWQRALVDCAARHGAVLSARARLAVVGKTTPQAMEIVYRDIGQPGLDHEAGGRWLEDRAKELFAAGVVWRPGARELLAGVRAAGVPTALVTATARHVTEVMLETLGRGNFDVTVTHDDVVRGKPDPEPYLSAAAALGVDAWRCVAVEDSPTGVASAVAAGCVVLAIPAEVDLSGLTGVTVVPSLAGVDVAGLRALVGVRAGEADASPAR